MSENHDDYQHGGVAPTEGQFERSDEINRLCQSVGYSHRSKIIIEQRTIDAAGFTGGTPLDQTTVDLLLETSEEDHTISEQFEGYAFRDSAGTMRSSQLVLVNHHLAVVNDDGTLFRTFVLRRTQANEITRQLLEWTPDKGVIEVDYMKD